MYIVHILVWGPQSQLIYKKGPQVDKVCVPLPYSYFLDESMINIDGICGGDVEIMAASVILEVDIFVANNEYRWDSHDKFLQVVSWKLMRANTLNKEAIYIKNFDLHFEPVTSLINSPAPTFGVVVDQINLDLD